MSQPQPSANRQIARAAGVVMAGFVLSNLTSLVRQVLESGVFGTNAEIDAFNAAAQLPDTLFMLVAGGALASAFIPTFTDYLEKGDKDGAWLLGSAILNLVSLILMVLSVLAFLFADPIVRYVLAPNFAADQQALTASILRVLLLSPVIFGMSGLLMGVLNTHQHFLMPALAPTMHWLGQIIGIVFFVPSMGIHGLAWGTVLGAVMHFGVQLPALRSLDWHYIPTFGLQFPGVREVARLMGPRLIGVAVVQLNFWINVILASGQPEGSLTALKIGFKIMTMPQVVIAQAIAIAALPTFSAQVSRGDLSAMRTSLASTLRSVLLLSIPAAVGLIMLRTPVIQALLERGEFDANSTALAAWALLWYTVGLVSHSVVEIIVRAFYALHDTKTPVLIGTITMSLNIGFSILFANWFERMGWPPHGGLALGNTVATTLEMGGLLVLMRRRLKGLGGRAMLRGGLVASAGSLVLALGVWGWGRVPLAANPWWMMLGGIAVGGGLYGGVLFLLGVEEVRDLVRVVQARLGRRRNAA
jgi:putative peptidoglycan lipid II flippase